MRQPEHESVPRPKQATRRLRVCAAYVARKWKCVTGFALCVFAPLSQAQHFAPAQRAPPKKRRRRS